MFLHFYKFLFLLLISVPLYSQDTLIIKNDSIILSNSEKKTLWTNLKYDAKNIFGGIKYAYTQPARWEKDDFITAGAVVAGTTLLFFADEETNDFFKRQQETTPTIIRDFGWYFGSPQNNYGITTGVYLFGLITDNEKIRKTGVLLISAATASGLIQTVSKTVTGRARPAAGEGTATFKPFANEANYRSFPSGHTILAFTTAYAIGKQFENPWTRYGIYAVGLISPVTRLIEGAHWLTDVGLSLALTVAVVDSIDNYLNKENKYGAFQNSKKISWNLQLSPNKIGIIGTF